MQLRQLASRGTPSLRARCTVSVPRLVRCLASEETKPATTAGPKPSMEGVAAFSVADGEIGDILSASVVTLSRLGNGLVVAGYSGGMVDENVGTGYSAFKSGGKKLSETSTLISTFNRPVKTLELYEFESCPFCAKVREACCYLDLDVMMYPCPQNGTTWRPKAIALGGKKQFPLLVDPNNDKMMYESDDIVQYLFNTYGDGQIPWTMKTGMIGMVLGSVGSLARSGKGGSAKPSKIPEQPIVYYGYDPSPFSRVVREVLCELEIPYLYRCVARGSPKRQELVDKVGHFQAPYIEDPNTGVAMFESAKIKEYLIKTYAA